MLRRQSQRNLLTKNIAHMVAEQLAACKQAEENPAMIVVAAAAAEAARKKADEVDAQRLVEEEVARIVAIARSSLP